jgi:hypothetical protein
MFVARVRRRPHNLWLGFLVNTRTILILSDFQNAAFVGGFDLLRRFYGGKKWCAGGVYHVFVNHSALTAAIGWERPKKVGRSVSPHYGILDQQYWSKYALSSARL